MNIKLLLIMILTIANTTFAGYLTTQAEGYTPQMYGQTFLFTRPAFNNIAFEMNYWYDAWFDDKKKIAWEVANIYQSTTNNSHMSQTFLPPRKSSLTVRGSAVTVGDTDGVTDVLADWLYLPTNFEGTLHIKPQQWQNATVINARYCLGEISEYAFLNSWWLYASLPIVVVSNKLNFEQKDVKNPGPKTDPVYDIITAFENPVWTGLKFWNGTKKKIALGECRLGFGKTYIHTEHAHLASYSAVSIPTTKQEINEFIFEPQPGFDGHWGLINGVSLQAPVTRETDAHYIAFFIELELTSMFRNHQYRVLSLQNNPWSYFMQYRQQGQKAIPGINLLNKWVRVSSYEILDWATGFRFGRGVIQGEIGFGMWVNSQERLKLADDWDPSFGIAGSTIEKSASKSTIAKQALDDKTFITIPVSQLNVVDLPQYSRTTILYRVNASLGADIKKEKLDLFWGIGSFFESPSSLSHSSIFQQWGIWAKCGGAF